jgi:hypothetical protein
MSYTPYLSSATEALMKRVVRHVEEARPPNAMEVRVRAIARTARPLAHGRKLVNTQKTPAGRSAVLSPNSTFAR